MAVRSEKNALERRALWIARLTFIWALLIVGRLVQLQVFKHDNYVEIARNQHEHVIPVRATRGEILDRTGRHPLAISIQTRSVVINPQRVVESGFFASVVGPILNLPKREIVAEIEARKRRAIGAAGRSFLVLKRHISDDEAERLQRQPFPFVEIVPDSRREYPNKSLAAHVIGSVDRDGNGNAGIEQRLNTVLKGKRGAMRVLTDSLQTPYIARVEKPAEEGVNLTLTLDSSIQFETERALAQGVTDAGAESASIVVMRPEDGAVLALANFPDFDPNEAVPGDAKSHEAALARRRNIAVQAPCEPGSVMKMITISMAFDSGRYTPESTIYCENGRYPRPGRKPITDIHHGYGVLPVPMILVKSSNIGVAKVAGTIGPETFWDYLQRFGMGRKTGIELPGEDMGILRHQKCQGPRDNWCWGPSSHEYIAFGHEIAATAIQLARATAVVANGGYLVDPHLIAGKHRPRPDGTMEDLAIPRREPRRVISGETSILMRQIMQQVVIQGTGKRAKVSGWSTGGKTGSAEMFVKGQGWVNRHNSSFIGFAPVANPKIVVVVTLNNTPKQGGTVAAPIFAKVASAALRILQVPMDVPETSEAEPPVQSATSAPASIEALPEPVQPAQVEAAPAAARVSPILAGPAVPDFRGLPLVGVLRRSTELGIEVEVVGSGKARRQNPAPGEVLPAGGRVRVEFARQ
ncbi:MAG TPA: penicillin-binding transpeptidase domain-containing protein [Bryobacteraceae bacterium]|nr:penicillin-binding transpeptidase domain-containing protein [Bryobacteraceae bacterium]